MGWLLLHQDVDQGPIDMHAWIARASLLYAMVLLDAPPVKKVSQGSQSGKSVGQYRAVAT